jgi:hypothetical protein
MLPGPLAGIADVGRVKSQFKGVSWLTTYENGAGSPALGARRVDKPLTVSLPQIDGCDPPTGEAYAAVLGRVKRWVLAMLGFALRVAALPPLRGAFDSPCARGLLRVSVLGRPSKIQPCASGAGRTKGIWGGEAQFVIVCTAERGAGGIRSQGLALPIAGAASASALVVEFGFLPRTIAARQSMMCRLSPVQSVRR